jgi:PAS domain S-box-containing protein
METVYHLLQKRPLSAQFMQNSSNPNDSIIEDVSLRYELALSLGQTLNTEENVRNFLNVLWSRKPLTFASVWLREEKSFQLHYAKPHFLVKQTEVSDQHPLWKRLLAAPNGYLSIGLEMAGELNIHKLEGAGNVICYRLKDIGFVCLYDRTQDNPCAASEMDQLFEVMDKFANTLAGCRAHQRLQRIQHQIKESEHRFRQVINSSRDAVVITDSGGLVQEWNQEAEELFGYPRSFVIGKSITWLLLPKKQHKRFSKAPGKLLSYMERAANQHRRYVMEGQHQNGSHFPIEVSISSFETNHNALFSLFLRDITERQESESSLLHAIQEAENARMAEQQFLANMSHEIRTPMNSVIGMTHLLAKTDLNEEQKDLLGTLRFSSDSLLEVLNNILDLSKIEAGELEPEEKPFNLNALLQSQYKSTKLKCHNSGVDVHLVIDPQIRDYLKGDRTLLNQVLTNLLSNAVKFTREGSITLRADCVERTKRNHTIQFSVTDTGPGIPQEKQELIFKDFEQIDDVEKGKNVGTGLGLAIVKRLLSLIGGLITLESEPGKGSTFYFTLTFPTFHTDFLLTGEPTAQPKKMDSVSLKGLRALVAEDNPLNQKLIARILSGWGVQFHLAENGKQALHLAHQHRYDFVLMDLHMPEMNGVDATAAIRNSTGNPNHNIPIIALTAAAMLDEKRAAMKAGMSDFMTKPFSPALLKHMLRKRISAGPASDEKIEPMDANPSEKIDLSYLVELSGGDKVFIGEMLQTFLGETSEILDNLKEVENGDDHERTYQIAHKLKSSLKMIGMERAAELCLQIEEKARAEKADEIQRSNIKELMACVEQTIPALEEELASLD